MTMSICPGWPRCTFDVHEVIRHAVLAGRLAHGAGRIPRRLYAQASTPGAGRVEVDE